MTLAKKLIDDFLSRGGEPLERYNPFDLIEDDIVLPSQIFSLQTLNAGRGEKTLLVAIVENALIDYERKFRDEFGGKRPSRLRMRHFEEARAWLFAGSGNYAKEYGTLPYVCDHLGLNVEYVRSKLCSWRYTLFAQEHAFSLPAFQEKVVPYHQLISVLQVHWYRSRWEKLSEEELKKAAHVTRRMLYAYILRAFSAKPQLTWEDIGGLLLVRPLQARKLYQEARLATGELAREFLHTVEEVARRFSEDL